MYVCIQDRVGGMTRMACKVLYVQFVSAGKNRREQHQRETESERGMERRWILGTMETEMEMEMPARCLHHQMLANWNW